MVDELQKHLIILFSCHAEHSEASLTCYVCRDASLPLRMIGIVFIPPSHFAIAGDNSF